MSVSRVYDRTHDEIKTEAYEKLKVVLEQALKEAENEIADGEGKAYIGRI